MNNLDIKEIKFESVSIPENSYWTYFVEEFDTIYLGSLPNGEFLLFTTDYCESYIKKVKHLSLTREHYRRLRRISKEEFDRNLYHTKESLLKNY